MTNKLLLAQDGSELFELEEYDSVLILGPTGSGKGVSFVLPNLLKLEDSCVVHDIKLENYQITKEARMGMGHEIFPVVFLDGHSAKYNPLDFLDTYTASYTLIPEGKPKMIGAARHLFQVIVEYIEHNSRPKTLGEVARIAFSDMSELKKHMPCKSPERLDVTVSVLRHYLAPWRNPNIDRNTSSSDFSPHDLRNKKVTVYVGLTPADFGALDHVLRIFYGSIFHNLTAASLRQSYEGAEGVSFFLDDIRISGFGGILERTLPYAKGYKLRMLLLSYGLPHLEKQFGTLEADCIMSHMHTKLVLGANDLKTADYVSKLCGQYYPEVILATSKEDVLVIHRGSHRLMQKKIYYL